MNERIKKQWGKAGKLLLGICMCLALCLGFTNVRTAWVVQTHAAVKSIKVKAPYSKLAPGGKMKLSLTGAKSTAVNWYTSNDYRASVSPSGVVTANEEGEVTITATLKSNYYIKGSVTFTVKKLDVEGTVSTADGGDLLLSESSSKAVYKYKVSYAVSGVKVQVLDAAGDVIRTYSAGKASPASAKKVTWDLKDAKGKKVEAGNYSFRVAAAGAKIESESFNVFEESEFDAGNGSSAKPYEVSTLEQLKLVWKHNGVSFKQTADIDGELEDLAPMFTTDKPFTGTYDGGNFKISNLTKTAENDNAALFCAIGKGGTVKNLTVTDVMFHGQSNTAVIAAVNDGMIKNCSVKNSSVTVTKGTAGIVAATNNGTIDGCSASENTGSTNHASFGCIAGYNKGIIANCTTGSNTLSAQAGPSYGMGGIVGYNDGNIKGCTVTSFAGSLQWVNWNGVGSIGGIAGYSKGSVTGCTVSSCTAGGSDKAPKGGIIGTNEGVCANNNYQGEYNQTGNGK